MTITVLFFKEIKRDNKLNIKIRSTLIIFRNGVLFAV